MKHNLRKIWLLWLLLLSLFVIKSIVSAAPRIDTGVTMIPDEAQRLWYRSSLHTLNLGDFGWTTALLKHDNLKLRFSNWLVVWGGSKTYDSTYAVIGWWKNNEIQGGKNYAWIGGWESNIVKGQYAVIWGGQGNTAQWINAVVVGWNSNNSSNELSVIVWGQSNKGLNLWVVLWWLWNTASKNSLALGQNSESNEGSFAWNATANNGNGRVNAEGGILIGTTGAIDGVNLVVGGAVKVSWDRSAAYSWEIRYVSGCFYAFDGIKWHIMNRGDEESPKCSDGFGVDEVSQYCVFWNTIVWHWDEVVWYASWYAVITGPSNPNPCDAVEKTLVCYNKNLYVKEDGSNANGYYPYCYKINKN
jgi:hypothetical protein